MQIFANGALQRGSDRPRTLLVYAGSVWLWPGIPLTVKLEGKVEVLPAATTHFWIARLHGFEAQPDLVRAALQCAAAHLTSGDELAAQRALDANGLDRVSPEGSILIGAIGKRFGIEIPDLTVGIRSAPWGAGEITADLRRFDGFATSAARLQKAWNPDKHPRWPGGSNDGRGGQFRPIGAADTGSAYLDPPKSLEELQQAANDPEKGYEIHHIAEQTPAEHMRVC